MALMVSEEKLRKLFKEAYDHGYLARKQGGYTLCPSNLMDLFIEECKISLDKS